MRFSGLMTITWGENISECLPSMPEKKKEKCTATLLFHPQKAKTDQKNKSTHSFVRDYILKSNCSKRRQHSKLHLVIGRLRPVGEGGPKGGKSTTISKVKAWPKQCLCQQCFQTAISRGTCFHGYFPDGTNQGRIRMSSWSNIFCKPRQGTELHQSMQHISVIMSQSIPQKGG